MPNDKEAEKAIEILNGQVFGDRELMVMEALPKRY
jgi:RNA recognition motif-containing protein